jgi:S-adenosylmethionine-dependent methyltransferase
MSGDNREHAGFEGRAERFVERIYGSVKGELRLQMLWDDMLGAIPPLAAAPPLRVWDAGGGAGQIAARAAERGHSVLLSDISAEMLALAETELGASRPRVELRCASIETLAHELSEQFPLIICHAVLEWLADPRAALEQLRARMTPQGYLSLMFYNINSLMFTHALHGNVKKLRKGDFVGHPGGLTPPNPQAPAQVEQWLDELGLTIVSRCGIRTITEYLPDTPRFDRELMLELERLYCRKPPFLQLARYIHLVCRPR